MYKQKYLKYKMKYLELKNKMLGGATEMATQPSLVNLVKEGDLSSIKTMLENKPDLNVNLPVKRPPLYEAVVKAGKNDKDNISTEIIKLLLDNKADPDLGNEQLGYYPLERASINDRHDIAQLLINSKADINKKDIYESQPIHSAAAGGTLHLINLLLENKADINSADNYNETPLLHAIKQNNQDAIGLLLDKNANVEIKDKSNNNPLILAIQSSIAPSLLEELIDRYTDVNNWINESNNDGDFPLLIASQGSMPKKYDPIFYDKFIVELLLEKKANVNQFNIKTKKSPLYVASENNKSHLVSLLLKSKAQITPSSRYGNSGLSALDVAREKSLPEIIKLLKN